MHTITPLPFLVPHHCLILFLSQTSSLSTFMFYFLWAMNFIRVICKGVGNGLLTGHGQLPMATPLKKISLFPH